MLGALPPALGDILAKVNKEVVFCDQDRKGYALVTLTPAAASAEFVTVSTVLQKPFERKVVARYVADAGRPSPLRSALIG